MQTMQYCERLGPGLWAEPLNAVTNLAFVLAGVWCLGLWLRRPASGAPRGWDLLALVVLTFAIGVGSGLWHTLASGWSALADIVPIALLINLFLLSFLIRVVGTPWWGAAGIFLLYQGASVGLMRAVPADALNGSVPYLPLLVFLVGLWAWLARHRHPLRGTLAAAAGLFALSLGLRTADAAVCPWLPIGTHFLWHLLNGALIYLLVAGLIRYGRRGEPAGPGTPAPATGPQ